MSACYSLVSPIPPQKSATESVVTGDDALQYSLIVCSDVVGVATVMNLWHIYSIYIRNKLPGDESVCLYVCKIKQSRNRPGVAQRVPGGLGS